MTSVIPEAIRTPRLLIVFLIFVGATVLFFDTRHNSFPFTYHPDEDTKVHQIVSGKRNFFHPLLLLTTTSAVFRTGAFVKTPPNTAIVGRWVSATYTALAIVALVLLAWRWGGWLSAWGAAVFLSLNPLIFELAHYFKEDPCLLVGLAFSFLALDIFWRSPGPISATFLGLASALAISGKYVGALVLLFTLPPLLLHCRKGNGRLALWFLGGLLLTVVVVNLPFLRHWSDFQHGLGREVDGATGGHRGLNREIPHVYYLEKLQEITPVGIWLGLAATILLLFAQWKKWTLAQKLTLLFPFFFVAVLSFSPKTASRYLLPAETFFAFLAGVAPGIIFRQNTLPLGRWIAVCLALVTIGFGKATSWPIITERYAQFSTDSRDGLRAWLEKNTAPNAVIVQDGRVDLLADPAWDKRAVRTSEFAADLGTIDELKAAGVSYVAVTRQTYNRFIEDVYTPNSKQKTGFDRRTVFYESLFASGKPVWESQVGSIIYLNPGIRLYKIAPEK